MLPFNCSSSECDFTGIKCTDAAGTVFDTSCTDYYIECDNGFFTNPMIVPPGTHCLAGELVLSSACPSATCTFEGIKCSDAAGTLVSGSCTAYYVECVDGAQSRPLAVASGQRCLNDALVLASACSTPQCSFTGVQCVDASGTLQTDACTGYYRQCTDGVLAGPIATAADQQCYHNALVASSECPASDCDFTGFICSDAAGALLTNTCADYYVRCVNGKYSAPVAVSPGQRLLQPAADRRHLRCVLAHHHLLLRGHPLRHGGRCDRSRDHCTNYFVMCSGGRGDGAARDGARHQVLQPRAGAVVGVQRRGLLLHRKDLRELLRRLRDEPVHFAVRRVCGQQGGHPNRRFWRGVLQFPDCGRFGCEVHGHGGGDGVEDEGDSRPKVNDGTSFLCLF